MHSRTFLHVSLGILALAAAYHLGARTATAQATMHFVPQGYTVFSGSQLWSLNCGGGWCPVPASDMPPVSPSSLAVLVPGGFAITQSGEGWWKYTGGEWINVGLPPGGPTPVRQESMGAVKARYR